MQDLSTTAATNSPSGSESPISTDNHHRATQAILRHTQAKGADIASATTTDIGAATGYSFNITGTTTITSLGTIAAGILRQATFTGALTLTHNATSLILPSSANITTAAGDVAEFTSLGSGNWKCTSYTRQSGGLISNTFASDVSVPDEVYGVGWNASLEVPTKNAVYDKVQSLSEVPAGTIIDYAGTSAPTGYLVCPTAANSSGNRTTHTTLFAAIGTTWGAGDGSTTFGLPWFTADTAGIQANANVGSQTAGQVITHNHLQGEGNTAFSGRNGQAAGALTQGLSGGAFSGTTTSGNLVSSTGGTNNLPAGSRVLKCVKT
jgi:hypothetical protein